jgi:dienelactone hydrolase
MRARHRRARRVASAAVLGLAVAVLLVLARRPLAAHVRAVLLLAQELPQSPIKPLGVLAAAPFHEGIELESAYGTIVADLFVPTSRFGANESTARPAVVLVMGIKVSDHHRPILIGFADTLARLGFVVLWPRLAVLDQGVALPEEPATVVAGIQHLTELPQVDRERISLLGFSVGASTAFVAASTPGIADDVHAIVFFGGYFDLLAYLLSLATGTMVVDGQPVSWQPEDDAVGHMRQILQAKDALGVLQAFDATTREQAEALLRSAPERELAELRRYSPAEHLDRLQARLFVLHDESDRFVPFVESVKLARAQATHGEQSFLLKRLFEHAQFKEGTSWHLLADLGSLYGFVHQVLVYLD